MAIFRMMRLLNDAQEVLKSGFISANWSEYGSGWTERGHGSATRETAKALGGMPNWTRIDTAIDGTQLRLHSLVPTGPLYASTLRSIVLLRLIGRDRWKPLREAGDSVGTPEAVHRTVGLEKTSLRLEYKVIFERAESNWAAYVPELPGCMTTGRTLEETEANIREAIDGHVETLREFGESVPEPRA